MFPIKDHTPSGKFPIINLTLIAVTVYVFFQELASPNLDLFLWEWALIPSKINFLEPSSLLPFLTSMFLHAGWLHIISNMWFLWIFGDNVESHLGHLNYLAFYLFSGVVAGFVQYLFAPNSFIPMLGASGAVAGALGAYLVFFSKHKIETLVPIFGFFTIVQVPTGIMLIYWFFTQLFSGVASLAAPMNIGGVAWWAHISGFAFGYLVGTSLKRGG